MKSRGVGSSRCGWERGGVIGDAREWGIAAAEIAKTFHASTRRRISARILRRPSASAVVTVMVGFWVRQSAFLSADSLAARLMSRRVATSSMVGSVMPGGGSIFCIA